MSVASLKFGRLVRDGTLVKPDPRKGECKVVVDDQELVHFIWNERRDQQSGIVTEPEVDVIIFPGEAVFEKVCYSECFPANFQLRIVLFLFHDA